jgi:N-acetylmuramoyl-L-alanine amidase
VTKRRFWVGLLMFLFLACIVVILATPAGARAAEAPLIVIDAGHNGTTLLSIDPQFNMYDYEYSNGQENIDDWNVSVALKSKLEAAGYRVMLTKTGPSDSVSKRVRIDMANNNGAALFIFIHRDAYSFGSWGHAYAQFLDGWRADVNGNKVYFKDACPNAADVAARSLVIATSIVNARKAIEGSAISLARQNYTGRGGYIPDGDLSILSLWATVPSILVEAGIPNTAAKVDKYAQGLFNGIAAAIPLDGVLGQIGTVVNCTVGVNVRSGPGTSYSTVGSAPKGVTYPVLSQSESWYAITYNGGVGYISAMYLSVSSSTTPPPVTPPPPSGPTVKLSVTEGQVLAKGVSKTITATTTNAVKVIFYLDGVVFKTDTASPYSVVFQPNKAGARTLKAVAYDKSGATATVTVNVVVK